MILADLSLGRTAYDNQNWGEARSRLRAADAQTPLGPEDVVRLATAAQLQGQDEEAAALLQRAHNAYLKQNEVEPAVRCAVQLIMSLINREELARPAAGSRGAGGCSMTVSATVSSSAT